MDTDDKKLQDIAQKIINKIPHDENDKEFGAIITILIIISITLTIIRIIQECNKVKWLRFNKNEKCAYMGLQIKDKALRQSFFTKRAIKKVLRGKLSPEHYNKYGNDIMNAILDSGVVVTDDEVLTLMEAANV